MIYTSPHPPVVLPNCSVYDLLWSNPNRIPASAVAIIDGPSGRTLTRADIMRQSQALAFGFRNKLNLQPEAVVCIFSPNSFYYHLLVSSLQCAGLVVCGANAAYQTSELVHQLKDSDSQIILVHPSILDVALASTTQLGWTKTQQRKKIVLAMTRAEAGPAADLFQCFDDLISYQLLSPHPIQNPETTVAFIGYSSGTSGAAKGVRTSHRNMTSVLTILKPFDVSPSDTHLAVLPLNHIYGLSKLLLHPLVNGIPVVVMPKFELVEFCQYVEKYKVSVVLLVPPIVLLLARDPRVLEHDMSSLRLLVSGAAPLGPELQKELEKRLDTHLSGAYGLTESSPTTHYCPIDTPRPGSIGPLLPNLRARICDPVTGEDLGPGKEGELLIQGATIMLGYLNRPDATAETLMTDSEGTWLRTGDIGFVDTEGFFFITDRLKELIKYKGFQVAPAELEAELLSCPYVNDACIVGVYAESMATELPRAYVVLSAEGKRTKNPEAAIEKWISTRVASHKRLRGGVIVQEMIPKSPSGKLLRRILRDQAKIEYAAEAKSKL